jgi:hypothetical protein
LLWTLICERIAMYLLCSQLCCTFSSIHWHAVLLTFIWDTAQGASSIIVLECHNDSHVEWLRSGLMFWGRYLTCLYRLVRPIWSRCLEAFSRTINLNATFSDFRYW